METTDRSKWYSILHTPIGRTACGITDEALRDERRSHEKTFKLLQTAVEEAEAARRVLAVLLERVGGTLVVTDTELERIDVNAQIRSQHDSERDESTIWVGTRAY